MSEAILSEALLSKLAGWQAMKQARSLHTAGRVLRSEWNAPTLRGAVQEGQSVYQCGLVIRSVSDADNLCPCRDSRQRGLICAHSVAAGLHFLLGEPKAAIRQTTSAPVPATAHFPARPRLQLAGGLAILQARLDGSPAAAERLRRCGFAGPDPSGLYALSGQNAVLNFFAREYPRLEKEWEVTLEERLRRSAEKLERVEPRFQVTPSGEQWFELNITYTTGGGEALAPAEIQRLLRAGQGYAPLRDGRFALIDTGAVEELEEVLIDCNPRQHNGAYRINNTQAGFLEATLRERGGWQAQAPAAWRDRAARQRGEIKISPPQLGALDSVLRPYQKEGVAWLGFLRANGFGGILADEMGLGKTVQVLAHLRATQRSGPSLVVCPASLVFNWEAEARRFTPDLRLLALQGTERAARLAEIPAHDLVITSYSVLRRDAEFYRDLAFDTVVLDEAQHIKNRQTQNAQAVKSVRSNHRLVVTGTPLENSVLDLWSIFDFLMPGYLGPAQDFRERYEIPITRDRNSAVQVRLARRLRPFILRRAKKDVAADLPAKIEQTSYCELNPAQRTLYQQVLEAGWREVLESVNKKGVAQSRMAVLTALLRLRQICCDPRLLKLPPPGAEWPRSGKTGLFHELLDEALDGGHRVLVFSQFTSMLALLGEELAARQVEYCYLDGATKDRGAVVERFQKTEAIPVFLISLKAGGVGLNLTGADTVIHFDPWWNPAVESQATDRAHRIGQANVVTSYKLIARDTVEEKILHLQNRKRALTQSMLGGEETFAETLTWDEIQGLLGT